MIACTAQITLARGAVIKSGSMGISVYIPPQSLGKEEEIGLLIYPRLTECFKLPEGYESASPTYHIKLSREIKFLKNVKIKMHHHADIQTEEDCKAMAFASASTLSEEGQVGTLEKIVGASCTFQPGSSFGEITLQHFCFMKIIRSILNRGNS